MIDLFFSSINGLSVACMLVFAALFVLVRAIRKQEVVLHELLSPALSAATIPTGVALILCAFNPQYVSKLESFNVHLSVAGIALLFLAIHTTKQGLKHKSQSAVGGPGPKA